MLIQIYLIAVLLFLGGVALDSITNKRCSCSAISSQTDCENDDTCHWLTIQGKCVDVNTVTNYRYCDAKEASECANTLGCAYYNNTCTFFTGCSAYAGKTFEDCQKISVRCFGYGGTWCVNGFACTDYTSDIACQQYPNPMGKKNCFWNSSSLTCNYTQCDHIDQTISTDQGCKEYNPDCVTTGFGCTLKLTSCSNYTGDSTKCLKYIGSDGKCQLSNSTNCEARTCAKASSNFTTDDDCASYLSGCITTGLGCVDGPTRPKCETYNGTKEDCEKMIGSDGQCSKSADASNCKSRVCSDALRTTDIACDEYLSGCITDGQKCVAGYQDCGTFTGNQSACSFIGSKGMCTSPDTQISNVCQLMDCVGNSDATYTTDEMCMKIQKNCKTTGSGCVDGLALCSLSTDLTKCDGSYGSDGKCYKKSDTECAPKDCSLATASTNADCLSYSTKCVKSESGCAAFSSCPSIGFEGGCTSSTGCNWKGICIYSASCGTFGDENTCTLQKQKTVVTSNGVSTNVFQKCFWSANQCRLKVCSDIVQADVNSDSRCDADIKGCIMNGKGCLSTNDLCSLFYGTQKQCESYTPSQKCSNIPDATESTYCIPRTCDTNKEATSDDVCKQYLSGCVTNGKGCISETADCTSYQGTKAQCEKFQGVSGLQECTNSDTATDNQTCYQKQCVDDITAQNDSDCKTFSSRCMWGGQKCVNIKNAICSDYYGKAADCQAFKSTCYGSDVDAACRNKACTDFTGENPTLQQCQDFLSGCIPQTSGCLSYTTPCSAIKGLPDFCNGDDIFGNSLKCTNRYICQTADCSLVENPTSNLDCLNYHPKCRFNASTNKCIVSGPCSTYPVSGDDILSKLNYCTSFTDNNSKYCGYSDGDTTCSDRKCDQWRISFTNTCDAFINTLTTGTQICAVKDDTVCYEVKLCSDYTVVADGTELDQCKKLVEGSGTTRKSCTFDSTQSTTNCIAKLPTCEEILTATSTDDCNTQFGSNGCLYTNSKCYTIQDDCTKYVVTAEEGSTLCSTFKEYISVAQIQQCAYVAGSTTCSKIVCENISTASSLANCQSKSQSCWYYSNKCYTIQTACNLYNVDTTQTSAVNLKFCQGMRESTNRYVCNYKDGDPTCSDAQANCAYTIPTTSVGLSAMNTFCKSYRDQNGYICWANTATDTTCTTDASSYCTQISGVSQQSDCDAATFSCMFFSSSCQQQNTLCTSYFNGGGSSDNKALTCQKYRQSPDTYSSLNKITLGDKCTWISVGTGACELAPSTCNVFDPTGSTSKQGYCENRYNKNNVQCTWKDGDTKCREKGCYDLIASSKLDCPQIDSAVCQYYKSTCIKQGDPCTSIYAIGNSDSDRAGYCQGITGCNYIMSGKFCITNLANGAYDVSSLMSYARQSACILAGVQLFSDKTVCESTKSCELYTGGFVGDEQTACGNMKNTDNRPCLKHPTIGGSCTSYKCSDVTSPSSWYDCNYYAPDCQYYDSACYDTSKQCYEFTIPTGKDITWCNGLKDSFGNYCKGTIGNTICAARVCSDVVYDNHLDCIAYSNLCKSDGYICVSSTNACNTFTGSKEYCLLMQDTDGQRCDGGSTPQSQYCSNRLCRDNVTLTTDQECNDFLSGCITRGTGCTDANQPCSYFKGTKTDCEKYTGVYAGEKRKCSGDPSNTATSGCRDRQCTDNLVATTSAECTQWGTNCTNLLIGCIDSSEPCSKYTGNQQQCSKFIASNNTKQCWSDELTDSTKYCKELSCTDVKGTTDAECAKSLLGAEKQCISNGKRCLPNSQPCSVFQGNEFTCPNFTAKADGPCKSSLIGYKIGPCTPRICSEAPIWYNTDAQCLSYHPSCRTNGNGCQSGAIECNMISDSDACSLKPSCNWVPSCLTIPSQCSEITIRTACVQQSITYTINGSVLTQPCYWENGKCRNKKCQDFPLKTHAECQAINTSCTSTGSNCITKAKCSEYTVMTVCNNAQSDTDNVFCYWDQDINKCRLRKCTDSKATSSKECSDFMTSCITTGVGCVDKNNYSCNDFNGSKLNCYKDSTGTPCLYLEDTNQCITYVQCESVLQTTLEACQKISPLCSTDGKKCVAISKCSSITLKEQCTKGTDGDCAWLPFQDNNLFERCIKFSVCSVAYGTSHDQCQAISKSCISNSKICVAIAKCEEYKYKMACLYGGTDGKCTWDGAKNSCRLQVCSDNQLGSDTHSSCQAFDKSCTTDGTSCISLAKCSEYTNEKSCVLGTDGSCIYSFSIGYTSGNKSCRLPDCSDYQETSTAVCDKQLSGCISDGSQCTTKKKCTDYKTQTACQSGGIDGNVTQSCVFLAANNTCAILSKCSDASTDQVTCNQNSHACQWKTSTNQTATCVDINCSDLTPTESQCTNILTFDKSQLKICTLNNNTCQSVDMCNYGTYITESNCHKVTGYNYQWSSNKCTSCNNDSCTTTNNTNTCVPNNTNNNCNQTTTYSYFLSTTLIWMILQ